MGEDGEDAVNVAADPFPGGIRLVVTGPLDISNASPVARLLRDATRDRDLVVLDLDAVTFLDSLAVAELHHLHRDFTEASRMLQVIAGPETVVGKVLRLTRLDTVWNIAAPDDPIGGDRPAPSAPLDLPRQQGRRHEG